MSRTKAQELERKEAIETLREIVKPGSRVYCILRNVSRSGMSRVISLVIKTDDGIRDISWLAAKATATSFDRDRHGLKMGGCGMDMGFAAVNDLSASLYGRSAGGYACLGDDCPSNHHRNGDSKPCGHCDGTGQQQTIYSNAGTTDCLTCRGSGQIRVSAPRGPGIWHDDEYAISHEWL